MSYVWFYADMKKLDTTAMLHEFLTKGNTIKKLPKGSSGQRRWSYVVVEHQIKPALFGAYRCTAAQRKANRIARKKGLT